MKCHYEILGIPLNATSDEIKKAYRKLALEWHPDKNLHRPDEAKETFQLLQQAYEILSDVQERAWYDRHREEILRGGLESEFADDSLDVYQYFNSSCFKGYEDDQEGFYSVYRDVFHKIAEEDRKFMDDPEEEIPSFGYSHNPYEEVHAFYAYWQSYCTARSFSWLDKHDLTELRKGGVGRQVLRAIEKENKKLRDQHKKIRNEEVRQLVAFVRKRDKRVKAHQKLLEVQSAEKAKKFQEKRAQQLLDRRKDLESYQEAEWSSMAQFEDHFDQIESHLDDTFGEHKDVENDKDENLSDEEDNDCYCVACDKDFRSLKSMKNHEKSKKHKENIEYLKVAMKEEEANRSEPNSEDAVVLDDVEDNAALLESDEEESKVSQPKKLSKKKKKKNKKAPAVEDEAKEVETEESMDSVEKELKELHIESNCTEDTVVTEQPVAPKAEPSSKKAKKTKKSKPSDVNDAPDDDQQKQSTLCEKCGNNYHSRNRLFEHLKESGHAMYLGEDDAPKKTKNSSKKNAGGKKKNR